MKRLLETTTVKTRLLIWFSAILISAPTLTAAEVDWLKADLNKTGRKTVVFAHQRLDVNHHYGVKKAAEVRKLLEESGKVLAVFQGHNHVNDHKLINGIHYVTLVAMVEGAGAKNNGYSTMDMFDDGCIRITGFRKQKDYEWRLSGF